MSLLDKIQGKQKMTGSSEMQKKTPSGKLTAMQIRMKELPHCHTRPTQGSPFSAAYDLYSAGPVAHTIFTHKAEKVPTGICIEIPNHFCGLILPRSGLASDYLVVPANSPGLIDPDYRGEIIVALTLNKGSLDESYEIQPGKRIAQLLIVPYVNVEWVLVDELNETSRGEDGFGSTGD